VKLSSKRFFEGVGFSISRIGLKSTGRPKCPGRERPGGVRGPGHDFF
jgi:hypothetical protein